MSKQSCGVWGTKWLIRKLFPEAVKAFDPCAAQHDRDYKTVDWSKGAFATEAIDQKFYQCCLIAAHGDDLLEADAYTFYRACRKWGRMRAALWKFGVRY